MNTKDEQDELHKKYDFIYLGNGPAATGSSSGWTMSSSLYFKCIECGYMMCGDAQQSESCFCWKLHIDVDAGRFGSQLGDDKIEVYRAEPRTES